MNEKERKVGVAFQLDVVAQALEDKRLIPLVMLAMTTDSKQVAIIPCAPSFVLSKEKLAQYLENAAASIRGGTVRDELVN